MAWEQLVQEKEEYELIEHEPAFNLPTPKTFLHPET
jgi:hypothetical protein